jgi:V/A-type H+-transporting ATPase subunit I
MFRPRRARWFTLLCGNAELLAVLHVLAGTRGVETVARGKAQWQDRAGVEHSLAEFAKLRARFGPYWPAPRSRRPPRDARPIALARAALAALQEWATVAGDVIEELVRLEHAAGREALQLEWLSTLAASRLDPTLAPIRAPGIATHLFVVPIGAPVEPVPGTLLERLHGSTRDFLVTVGAERALGEYAERIEQAHGRAFNPVVTTKDVSDPLVAQAERLRIATEAVEVLRIDIDRISESRDLAHHLGTLEWLTWAWVAGRGQPGSHDFAWVGGWIERSTAREIDQHLHARGVHALVAFPDPPPGVEAPVVLDNPRWVRPFEGMTRLFGLPGPDEADPSPLLGIVVPLLFGYMFGDVGQGLLIAMLGLALRGRFPVAALAVPCGLSAALFGVLFGSVFGLEGLMPALWVHPIEAPQAVLLPPLLAGAALLLTGIGLGALEAYWRGSLHTWWFEQGGLLCGYLVVLGLFVPPLAWLPAVGLAWWFGMRMQAAWRTRDLPGLLGALFEWLEQSVRLLVNTLSFARVGAFALAHASLSLATVQLAATVPWRPGEIAILVLGNLIVLGLEGLIVSIQTTRLMLFEFFLRFLRGEGRAMRPLVLPKFG